MRTLYVLPVLHALCEMGKLQPAIVRGLQECGQWQRYNDVVPKMWQKIEEHIRRWGLFSPEKAQKLHIFIDGIPMGLDPDVLQEFLSEAAQDGSQMFSIALELQEKGAQVHGLEDAEIIAALAGQIQQADEQGRGVDLAMVFETIAPRNEAIIRNIDEQVPDGENALLFIGMGHTVSGWYGSILESGELQSKFKVITPGRSGQDGN